MDIARVLVSKPLGFGIELGYDIGLENIHIYLILSARTTVQSLLQNYQ